MDLLHERIIVKHLSFLCLWYPMAFTILLLHGCENYGTLLFCVSSTGYWQCWFKVILPATVEVIFKKKRNWYIWHNIRTVNEGCGLHFSLGVNTMLWNYAKICKQNMTDIRYAEARKGRKWTTYWCGEELQWEQKVYRKLN